MSSKTFCNLKLDDYLVITTHGFLPSEPPLQKLPSYYEPWETICSNLYRFRTNNQLRERVSQLPVLTTGHLTDEPQWRRAFVLLGFITNAYIWGSREPQNSLPVSIANPFIAVAQHLEVPPSLSYAAQNLWNYKPLDPNHSIDDPDNFQALITFTDSAEESWFYALPAAIEARGAPIIPLTLKAFNAASLDESRQLLLCLQEISGHIEALTMLLPRMYEKLDPTFFYNEIRPFLAGTTNVQPPDGLFYQTGYEAGEYMKHPGPTAAQSSLFHFLDIAFGIRHLLTSTSSNKDGITNGATNGATVEEDGFLKNMRLYMPSDHRRFLEDVSNITNLRDYVKYHPQNVDVQDAYNDCLEKLVGYRKQHIKMVSRYIVVPSRMATRSDTSQTGPQTAGLRGRGDSTAKQEALGTGGTAPILFLKQVRDETQESVLRD